MTKELDVTKPCMTRSGLKAEFIRELKAGTTGGPNHPLLWVVTKENGMESVCTTKIGGNQYSDGHTHQHDIINAPQTSKVWVSVYLDKNSGILDAKKVTRSDKKPTAIPPYIPGLKFCGWQGPFEITDTPDE